MTAEPTPTDVSPSPSAPPAPASPPAADGLTAAEAAERRRQGHGNELPSRTSRRYRDIVAGNVFTRFTAVIAVLAAVVLVVGEPLDAIFALVMVSNILIGTVQEVRAKRTLDRLQVLIAPTVRVRRDGAVTSVPPGELVLGDVIELEPGDQVPVDGRVLDGTGLEVDESSLTGESDPVDKQVGDEVLSGSAVVAGRAAVLAERVGTDARIHQLVAQAKEFVLTSSELRTGIDRILRVISWLLVPLTALLLWSQLRADMGVAEGLVSAVAGVVGLVPQGLVLLVSLAMAVAIGRLARNHVVVQELYAVEGLARVDVLCVDKTGTLTTGSFTVEAVEPLGGEEGLETALAALAGADRSPNATMQVLAEHLRERPAWPVERQVPFSSARKWSGMTFGGHGTWLVGAPEVLLDAAATDGGGDRAGLDALRDRVAEHAAGGRRVLLVARADAALVGEELPVGLRPAGLVVLAEEIRADAADTMAYFARQHVTVKVISGDNPRTVSAVAARIGLPGAGDHADLRGVTGPLDELVASTTVFGRVLPEQKRELVEALQRAGHVVAMTGDGVNDIPSLKKADIGIAMDTATPATKGVAQLILLDGRFDRLPDVVAEGRRVIANMERVSSLFLSKTVYAAVFAVIIGLSGAVFPFRPRHMSLVSELTVGLPALILSFRSSDRPIDAGYLQRVFRFAVPSGLAAAAVTLSTYWLCRSPLLDLPLAEGRTASTVALVSVALWVLSRLVRPLDRFETALLAGLVALHAVVLAVPALRRLYALDLPDLRASLIVVGWTAGWLVALEVAARLLPVRWTGTPTGGRGR